MIEIREAKAKDFDAIWSIFQPIVSMGETYAYSPKTTKEEAFQIWMEAPLKTYVALEGKEVIGTYYLKANQPSLGAHVCNCGYMVAETAKGKGVASRMCEHSQQEALKHGFKAMQYNLVASTNTGAVRLWQKLGFEIVGILPKAFQHKSAGLVDAYVMYKWLA